jgi:CubicO group peptidase (beta-lactamase class C family)
VLALAAAGAVPGKAAYAIAKASPRYAGAMAAIRTYAEAHRNWFGLPGLTLGVTSPGGFSSVVDVGFANLAARSAITPPTLFQIGSISKSFTAALLHQFAAEGRFRLSDRIVALLPGAPLPANSAIEVQHLLDHVAGIPGDAPLFVPGGLWTTSTPGEHWLYSNTGYDLLGKLAEHVGGEPLDRLFEKRLFKPLGMNRSRGAIVAEDRLLYAQGYEAANTAAPFVRGAALAPAAWISTATAAGSIASTAADMTLYLRSLASAAQGRGGMGLGPRQGLAFATHAVPSDSPEMRYGNGLMHVEDKGRRYLLHTGGMVSFTSAFHIDTANGIGAFASSNLSAFTEYRPRGLTLFAVQALSAAEAGQPVPEPPALERPIHSPGDYVGRYRAGERAFEVRGGSRLTIASGGKEAALEQAGPDLFRTLHPDFNAFSILFDRSAGRVVSALWGPDVLVREGAAVAVPPHDPKLQRFAGRYINDSPWNTPAIIVERGGKLWGGTETPLTRIGDNLWRIGESWSPERAWFGNELNGRPQSFFLSGTEFARLDI